MLIWPPVKVASLSPVLACTRSACTLTVPASVGSAVPPMKFATEVDVRPARKVAPAAESPVVKEEVNAAFWTPNEAE